MYSKNKEFIDYYKIMGIGKNASLSKIQTAYKEKALQLHPDKNPGKDTTVQMQELNRARDTLTDENSRIAYDTKLNSYHTENQLNKFMDKKNSTSRDFNSFFSTKKQLFQIDDWRAQYNSAHLFIYHPKLKGCKDNITFWDVFTKPSVSLPINDNLKLRQTLRKYLIPQIPLSTYWLCDNETELVLQLPNEKNLLHSVLNIIFGVYQFPEELSTFVREKYHLQSNVEFNF